MKTLELMTELKLNIESLIKDLPYYNIYISTLGGEQNASILFSISLDKKDCWHYGIFENSRYISFHVYRSFKGLQFESFVNYKTNLKIRNFGVKIDESEKLLKKFGIIVEQIKEVI